MVRSMFKVKNLLGALALAAALCAAVPDASAHELVPQALIDYVQAHPNATAEEIRAYAEQKTPAFAERFPNGTKIFDIARNQHSGFVDTMFDFFQLGVQHILTGPDHILFVLSLLLAFVSYKEILKLTGSFTLAHSITLILAGTGTLVLTSRVVEPMIALSIAAVALGTVYLKKTTIALTNKRKLGIVFFFGLFHGLGFAGLLRELGVGAHRFIISLVAFNVGIEVGQIVIIAIALPLILLARRTKYYNLGIKIFGTTIGVIGLLWALERVLSFTFFGF